MNIADRSNITITLNCLVALFFYVIRKGKALTMKRKIHELVYFRIWNDFVLLFKQKIRLLTNSTRLILICYFI